MRFKTCSVVLASLPMLCALSHADFKYTEKTQITGGALIGMTKMASVFSKDARHATDPATRTVAVKGNKLRTEESDGKIEIIDLDGKQFINIDPATQSYTIVTFDDMKKAMQQKQAEMQAKMQEEQARHPDQAQQANMKITPKFESTETGATQTLLGVPTKELKATVTMTMESTDPKTQGQQVQTVFHTDQWIAPDLPHYQEIRDFYLKMAKEMDWFPGQFSGMMANSNIQLSMRELRKSSFAHINGMPMLTYSSMTMAANGSDPNAMAAQQQAAAQQQQQQQQQQQDSSFPTNPSAAVMKGLGGMFGHKKDKQQQDANASSGSGSANPASTPGSMMDTKTEITSYSTDSLDASLFAPPAGYTQKQVTADDMMRGGRH